MNFVRSDNNCCYIHHAVRLTSGNPVMSIARSHEYDLFLSHYLSSRRRGVARSRQTLPLAQRTWSMIHESCYTLRFQRDTQTHRYICDRVRYVFLIHYNSLQIHFIVSFNSFFNHSRFLPARIERT